MTFKSGLSTSYTLGKFFIILNAPIFWGFFFHSANHYLKLSVFLDRKHSFLRVLEYLSPPFWLYMEFCKQAGWAQEEVALLHFRDKKKNEVDMVLERKNGKIIGVEVKASATINAHDFTGLAKLAEFSGNHFEQGVLFYSGEEVLPFRQGEFTFYALPVGLLIG